MFKFFAFSQFFVSTLAFSTVEMVQLNGSISGSELSSNKVVFAKYNGAVSSNKIGNNEYDLFWELDGVTVSEKPYLYIDNQYLGSQLRFCVRKRGQGQINCSPSSNIINSTTTSLRSSLQENVGSTSNYIYDKRKLRMGDSITSKSNFYTENGSKASGVLIYGKDQRNDIVEARFVPVVIGLSDNKIYNNINSQTTEAGKIRQYSSCSVLFFESGLPATSTETCKGPFVVRPK
ncbi:hypothetical protein [Vibrio brasiliensis]|uniref:hypothetical protein n=1 Tax=Vibrio brasiliensis TaxID=170652 RepID=UPI001EFDC1AD|nr:hypothetical protein [Vibrio brasiliensis]MCG9649974.1 hypothetical protein [Vibrio brasiliensis]MCG9726135.1 hypothetical protein [Vibrio brasiliensis]